MSNELLHAEIIDQLLDELDAMGKKLHPGERSEEYWVCQRRYPRHPFRVPCMVRFRAQGETSISELPGRTRNLSRNGLALLIRHVFTRGDMIEVEVHPPEQPPTFMVASVRFCRYAGRGFYEIGLQLKAAGPKPIISKQPKPST